MEGLVGDIGGTHARFALSEGRPAIREPRTYNVSDYPTLEAIIEAYLNDVGGRRPTLAVLAVAGPVTNGEMEFTNLNWRLSEMALREKAGFSGARLINDFAAQALGAPRVESKGLRRIGPDVTGQAQGTIAIMGPGTGFGLAALAYDGPRETVLATEGGHAGFAPFDEAELEIWRILRRRLGRVSIERVLSGPGLYDIYLALAEINGRAPRLNDEREVHRAGDGGDELAAGALDQFCAILGSTAGDIALSLGARGGVFITGGVALKLADRICAGGFRDRFESKGRFDSYMRAIPTQLVLEPYTALIGAAALLATLETS
jgi:glucokinase